MKPINELEIDVATHKFRCSGLSSIMTLDRATVLTAKQITELTNLRMKDPGTDIQEKRLNELVKKKNAKPELSKGAKTYCRQILAKICTGRTQRLWNKYLQKGKENEKLSLTLISNYLDNGVLLKNDTQFENEFISGTPDNVQDNLVREIKTSWSVDTFPMFAKQPNNTAYEWQVKGYMYLTDNTEADLYYALVDTPEDLVQSELYKSARILGCIDLPADIEAELRQQHIYNDLPMECRIRKYSFTLVHEDISKIKMHVVLARSYMLNQLQYLSTVNQDLSSGD